jgi:hypothetical protein
MTFRGQSPPSQEGYSLNLNELNGHSVYSTPRKRLCVPASPFVVLVFVCGIHTISQYGVLG